MVVSSVPASDPCLPPDYSSILKRLVSNSDWGVREAVMRGQFTLAFWQDGDWYVGRLVEVPGVFSQGKTLEELRENIQDAYVPPFVGLAVSNAC